MNTNLKPLKKIIPSYLSSQNFKFVSIFALGIMIGLLFNNIYNSQRSQPETNTRIKGAITDNLYFNIFDFIKQGFENDKAGIKWTVLAEDETSAVELVSIKDQMPIHIHKTEDHYTYVISGKGEYIQSGKSISLEPGKFILTPMKTPHQVISSNEEPLLLLVFSSPKPFREDDIEWIKNP